MMGEPLCSTDSKPQVKLNVWPVDVIYTMVVI